MISLPIMLLLKAAGIYLALDNATPMVNVDSELVCKEGELAYYSDDGGPDYCSVEIDLAPISEIPPEELIFILL